MQRAAEGGTAIGGRLGSLADRLGVAPPTIVIGTLAVVAASVGTWWAFSAPAPPPVEEVLPRVAQGESLGLPPAGPAPSVATVLVVHVDGAVVERGVHELAAGARVVDAVDAAGGLRPEADLARLNLAAPVADGQRVWVPVVGEEVPQAVEPSGGDAGDGPAALVDLNTAAAAELESLPGVGPTIAGAILAHREEHGPFRTIEGLLEVPGIGPARLAQLEPLVRV